MGVKTDVNLKRLFKAHGSDFLWLTGDRETKVLSVDVLELQEIKRSVDCVIRLRRNDEIYYRHIEFEARFDPKIAERCFRYNALLLLQLQAPVLTTVLYLHPPGPAESELQYRVMLGAEEINAWRFGVVRLWEIEAETALASGAPGLMALVPLLKGGDPAAIWTAAQRIRTILPGSQMSDAEGILWLLAEGRYNRQEFAGRIGRDNMQGLIDLIKQSPLYQQAVSEGEARGRAEGEANGRAEGEASGRAGALAAERGTFLKLVSNKHPELLELAASRAERCDDPEQLGVWILAARESDAEALARLLADPPGTL